MTVAHEIGPRGAKLITYAGRTLSVSAWAREIGMSRKMLSSRLNSPGWSIEQALSRSKGDGVLARCDGAGTLREGYRVLSVDGVQRREHILIAERALGKPLPAGAEVHHVDRNRSNNAPRNLVVCPDSAYHQLLHRRQRALDACGHADWMKCKYCKRYDAPENVKQSASGSFHQSCFRAYARQRYAIRKEICHV